MARILILLITGCALYLGARRFTMLSPQVAKQYARKAIVGILLGSIIILALAGRLHWLAVFGGVLAAFSMRLLRYLHYAPLLYRLWTKFWPASSGVDDQGKPSASGESHIETCFVRMWLDHHSGAMGGEVLQGVFSGRLLKDLERNELISLWRECAASDGESADLVAAYLDRRFGDEWRQNRSEHHKPAATHGPMTADEALAILGLSHGASRESIIKAHRGLIQKLHPDRGGSSYLAQQINRAKTCLLNARETA